MSKPLVLVIDDEFFIASLIRQTLEDHEMRVEVAASGREGLARAGKRRPAAIVLDAMMPGMDGFEVLRTLRATAGLKTIPVLMLTSLRDETAVMRATAEGATGYLVKPFRPDQLIERVRRLAATSAPPVARMSGSLFL